MQLSQGDFTITLHFEQYVGDPFFSFSSGFVWVTLKTVKPLQYIGHVAVDRALLPAVGLVGRAGGLPALNRLLLFCGFARWLHCLAGILTVVTGRR